MSKKKHKRQPKAKAKRKKKSAAKKPKSATASWRQFEQLVTRIENVLAPKGAIVKSPDFLTDKITGQPREVDASIRFKAGTTEIIITIECRDRIKIEDVLWIEQLATKQINIGSSKTIAVTSNSFTAPAITKAKMLGIEIRKVNKIDDASIAKWFTLKRTQYNYHIADFALSVDIAEEHRPKLLEELKVHKEKLFDIPFCTSYITGNQITLRKILQDFMNRCKEHIDKVEIPEEGHTGVITLDSKMPNGQIYITTSFGKFDLVGLKVGFTLYKHEDVTIKPVASFTYSDDAKDLIKGTEFEVISSKGTKELITVHTDIDSGTSTTALWKESEETAS